MRELIVGDLLPSDAGVVMQSLATAANDFLVASGNGVIVKKTLAETKAILGIVASTDFLVNQVFS
jgi:hypothetical protein